MAQKEGYFKKEIASVKVKNRSGVVTISEDEYPKNETTLESLQKLKPVFVQVIHSCVFT